jgi:hypothetical protein
MRGNRRLSGFQRLGWFAAILTAALLPLAGCGEKAKVPTEPPSLGLAECPGATNVFSRRNFLNSANVDNPWLPLAPGTQFILDGTANRGNGPEPHRVVLTITDLTKVIRGVRCVVLWDRDYQGPNLVQAEAELAFHCQDKFGNVWNMGEYPEEYENGLFVGAPATWIAGVDGADGGIMMPGTAVIGTDYLQGWAPSINFLDCGSIFQTGLSVCTPLNCYENVLEIDETSPLDVGSGHQRKYFAAGIGNIRIGAVGDPEAETLLLTSVLHLNDEARLDAKLEALALEKHAYQVSEVYKTTPPAQ